MAACSASPTKSRKLQSFIVLVLLNILFYSYVGTSGKCLSNFGEAEYRKADTLTGIHYDAVGRWRHFRPVFMFKHPKRKVYLASRLTYHPNSNASFNLTRLALCGDKNPNPGPDTSVTSKSKCKTCERTIARNHRTVRCQECQLPYHLKCSGLNMKNYRQMQSNMGYSWICDLCLLATLPADLSFSSDFSESVVENRRNDVILCKSVPEVVQRRKKDSREILVMHLNVNSLQNKIEEVRMLVEQFKAHVVFLGETKIDGTYPNSQFAINNYYLYRNDRVKGGGGLMAYFSSVLPSKRLKQPKVFKTIEVLPIQSKFGGKDVIVMGIYRSPKANGKNYYEALEKELHEICSWISLQRQFFIIMGDLNLNKLRPGDKEGKILGDLEEV